MHSSFLKDLKSKSLKNLIIPQPDLSNVAMINNDNIENNDHADESFESKDEKDRDSTNTNEDMSVEEKEVENNAEHLEEKGIEQFGLSDKFSQ